jgi:trehalose-6-phosphatase
MNTTTALPDRDTGWAMFLDVDGTLVDIERHPDEVRVAGDVAEIRQWLSASMERTDVSTA